VKLSRERERRGFWVRSGKSDLIGVEWRVEWFEVFKALSVQWSKESERERVRGKEREGRIEESVDVRVSTDPQELSDRLVRSKWAKNWTIT
jgi:hypothetical protein